MKKLYSTRDAFDIYVYYLAMKRHFTSNYDFIKYNGKVNASSHSFENRKDKFFFYRLSKMPESKDLILANLLDDPTKWIGEFLDDKAHEIYHEWLKRKQSLGYVFRTDLSELDEDFNSNFVVTDGQHPRLLKLYMMNRVSIETLAILENMVKYFRHWDKNISDNIVYPDINNKVKKYSPFLDYDKDKMRKIVLDKYNAI